MQIKYNEMPKYEPQLLKIALEIPQNVCAWSMYHCMCKYTFWQKKKKGLFTWALLKIYIFFSVTPFTNLAYG